MRVLISAGWRGFSWVNIPYLPLLDEHGSRFVYWNRPDLCGDWVRNTFVKWNNSIHRSEHLEFDI